MKDDAGWIAGSLPPIGCVCEVYQENELIDDSYWAKCEIIAERDGHLVFWLLDVGYAGSCEPKYFRPLRSKQECDRDELLEIMGQRSTLLNMDAIADAIIAAGWRRP